MMLDTLTASKLANQYDGRDALFYDGACPLCSKEMGLLAKRRDDALELVDIHAISNLSASAKSALLKNLHFLSQDGTWLTGLDANVAAWSNTPLGYVLKLCRLPGLRFLSDKAYSKWASSRFNKRYCRLEESEKCQ